MLACTQSLNSFGVPVCFMWSSSVRLTFDDRPSIAAASLAPNIERRYCCQSGDPCTRVWVVLVIFVAPGVDGGFLLVSQQRAGLNECDEFGDALLLVEDLLAPDGAVLLEIVLGANRQRARGTVHLACGLVDGVAAALVVDVLDGHNLTVEGKALAGVGHLRHFHQSEEH